HHGVPPVGAGSAPSASFMKEASQHLGVADCAPPSCRQFTGCAFRTRFAVRYYRGLVTFTMECETAAGVVAAARARHGRAASSETPPRRAARRATPDRPPGAEPC